MQLFKDTRCSDIFKRITALLLMTVIVAACVLSTLNSTANAATPGKALLEAMLSGERYWVIETLVNDNYTNNPQAKVNYLNRYDSMMKEALDGYYNAEDTAYGAIYKGMVDVLEKKVNADLYVQSFFDSVAELWNENILAIFGSGDSFKNAADDLSGSLDELQYESILKAALVADYTSSLGVTLGETESSYANVKQLQKALDSVKGWISYLRSQNKFAVDSTEYQSIETYINDCLIPYSDAVNGYLTSVSNMASKPNEFAQKYLTDIASFMVVMCEYEMHKGDDWLNYSFSADMAQHFADIGFMDVLKSAGKTLELGSMAIDNYIYLNMIQSQKETLTGPMYRISAATSDGDLAKVMTRFADLACKEADQKMIAYETIRDYLRQNNVAGEYASDAVKSMAKKLFNISDEALLIKTLAKIATIIEIATWGAEKAINVETTAKLTYELKYLDRIIDETVDQYYRDLAVYNGNKTEENAGKVLDDLLLLQRFRLRGETISYNMTSGQFDSWLGKLFTTESDIENYKNRYQKHIDVLIAAAVMPVSSNLITVGSGEELSLYYDYDNGWYGNYRRSSGETVTFGDAVSVMSNGVTLDGGTLNIYNTSGGSFSLPFISNTGNSTINISGGDFYLYELKNGYNLNVNLKNNSVLNVNGLLYTYNSLVFSGAYPVEVNNAELSGDVTGAMLKIRGDCIMSSNAEITSIDFCGTETQTVNGGGGNVGSLQITNSNLAGIKVEAPFNVRYSVYNHYANVNRGRNIRLLSTGYISGNYINNDITLDNVTLNNDILFGGSVYTRGNLTANGAVTINGSYVKTETGNTTYHTFADPNLTVKGDVNLNNMSLSGVENFIIGGDLEIKYFSTDRKVNISVAGDVRGNYIDLNAALTLNGNTAQKIKDITLAELIVNNTKGGVTPVGNIYIKNGVENPSGKIYDGEKITLLAGATLSGDIWRGSLTVNDWTRETPCEITENLQTLAYSSVTGEIDIGGNLYAREGINLTSAKLNISQNMFSNSTLTADKETVISVGNDFRTITADCAGEITVEGDVDCGSGWGNISVLRVNGKLKQAVAAILIVDDFIIENTSSEGINLKGQIDVNGTFYKNDVDIYGDGRVVTSRIVGAAGKMSALSLKDAVIEEDLTIDCGVTILNTLTVNKGTFTVKGAVSSNGVGYTVNEGAAFDIKGNATISYGALNLEGDLKVARDMYLSAYTIGNGTVYFSGDLNSASVINVGKLVFNGKTVQQIYSGSEITVNDLVLENASKQGVTLNATVNVNGMFHKNGVNVYGNGRVVTSAINGATGRMPALILKDATISEDLLIEGSLTVQGTLTVNECTLTLSGAATVQAYAVLNITENATLNIKGDGILQSCTVNNEGKISVARDFYTNGCVLEGNGTLTLSGDLNAIGSNITLDSLTISGKTAQQLYSERLIITKDVFVKNTSRDGVTLKSTVNYSGDFTNDNTKITGEDKFVAIQ